MIDEKLLTKKYYLDHMSMFLKGGYGIEKHVDIFLEYIQSLNNICDYKINTLDIWNENYITDLEAMYAEQGIEPDTPFEPLDKIAGIVGCQRKNVVYNYDDGIYENLVLDNSQLLELIKVSIIQNNYKGTYEELHSLYKEKLHYLIYPCLVKSSFEGKEYEPATVKIYIDDNKDDGTSLDEKIKKMFLYGNLLIKSMGITYQIAVIDDLENLFKLDETELDDESKYLG